MTGKLWILGALYMAIGMTGCAAVSPLPVTPMQEEKREAVYHLIVACKDSAAGIDEHQDRKLDVSSAQIGEAFRPFASTNLSVTIRHWSPETERVSLTIQHADDPPQQLDVLLRERRILPFEAQGKKVSILLTRKWKREDGTLDLDFEGFF